MKFVDDKLRDAFERIYAECGTYVKTAKYLGCSPKHAAELVTGKISYLNQDTWDRIELVVSQYIEEDPDVIVAPEGAKQKFVAENIQLLTDEEIDELVLKVVERRG